jgi:hypothetical protein
MSIFVLLTKLNLWKILNFVYGAISLDPKYNSEDLSYRKVVFLSLGHISTIQSVSYSGSNSI